LRKTTEIIQDLKVNVAVLMNTPTFSDTTPRNIVDSHQHLKQLSASNFMSLQDSSWTGNVVEIILIYFLFAWQWAKPYGN
jgi:hypothetical protein